MSQRVVTFGEIMMRLSPPGFQRFTQAGTFDVVFGGGEANVAASLVNYGVEVDYITRLPTNDLGDACMRFLRAQGVGVAFVIRGGDRLGIYFLETGAVARASKVIYDRAGSSLATIQPGMIDWGRVFTGATWFHWTGITPAVSSAAAAACLEAVMAAKTMGLTVSCDMNYRSKLWKWGKQPGEVMSELLHYCDIAVGNEEDAAKVFGIHAPDTEVTSGVIDSEKYRSVCIALHDRFPQLKMVAITLRGSFSASRNSWSAVLWDGNEMHLGPTFDISHIVDRVGGGDAFVGGLIFSLLKDNEDKQAALDFAVAASCLKHTIVGDFNLVTVAEVEKLLAGDISGRVSR